MREVCGSSQGQSKNKEKSTKWREWTPAQTAHHASLGHFQVLQQAQFDVGVAREVVSGSHQGSKASCQQDTNLNSQVRPMQKPFEWGFKWTFGNQHLHNHQANFFQTWPVFLINADAMEGVRAAQASNGRRGWHCLHSPSRLGCRKTPQPKDNDISTTNGPILMQPSSK